MEHMKSSGGTDVKERPPKRIKAKIKPPKKFKVIYHNDDYTPMEFVIHVLESFYNKAHEEATQIMLHVHQKGVGICGVYTFEVAEIKSKSVLDYAKKNHHPLQCTIEKT